MPRWFHQLYAWLGGYFWLPCPRCGRMFGGHEPKGGDKLVDGRLMMACSRCPQKDTPQYFHSLAEFNGAGVTLMPGESVSINISAEIDA